MRVVVLALVLASIVLAAYAQVQADSCNAAEREFCAVTFCASCRVSNGQAECTDEPSRTPFQTCASPCLENQDNDPTVTNLTQTMRACAYYDFLNTPHEQVLATRCAVVTDEAQCEAFAGLAEYTLGPLGSTCDQVELIGSVVLPTGSSTCCPDGMTSALVDMEFICISDDMTYNGPALAAQEPICTPSGCDVRAVSVLPGVGIVRGVNETADDVCDACAFLEVGDPCPVDCNATSCFEGFPTELPLQVLVANRTAIPGMCAGGVCVGNYNASVTPGNPQNNPCLSGYCRPRLRDEVLNFPGNFDVTNPALWPTPTCNPLCPGYPNCVTDCPGWPNPQDVLRLLEAEVSVTDLQDGQPCRQPSNCIPDSECSAGQCVAIETAEPICEQAACRECNPFTGTCDGPLVTVGSRCKTGCLVDETGTCDATGLCVGTPQNQNVCEAQLVETGNIVPPDPKDVPCYDIQCVSNLPAMIDFNSEVGFTPTVSSRGRDPFVSQAEIDGLVDETLLRVFGGLLSDCALVPVNTGNACDDFSLCTLNEVCDAQGFCTAQDEIDSFCQYTECRECNPATGVCDGVILPSFDCYSGCGQDSPPGFEKQGFCSATGTCDPVLLDETLCELSGDVNACLDPTCTSVYTGPTVSTPVGVQFPLSAVDAGLSEMCGSTPRAENTGCVTEANEDNLCIFSEWCIMGECVPNRQVDCLGVVSLNPCTDRNATRCDPADGTCIGVSLQNNTACDTDDVCFTDEKCIIEPPIGGIATTPMCVGTPSIDCSLELAEPCVTSSACRANPSTGDAECLNDILPNGVTCVLPTMPGVDARCQFGVCIPNDCPNPTVECQLPARDPMTGDCTFVDAPDNSPCTDGLKCTDDVCLSGLCVSTPIDCLPEPAECLIVAGCSESEPGDGCLYQASPDGTSCMNDLGECSGGICFGICDPPCQNGGVCFFSGGQPVCDCPSGFEGEACENASAPTDTSLFFSLTVDDVWQAVKRFGLLVLAVFLCILVAAIAFTVCCTCYGDNYEPDIRIEKRKTE